MPLDYRNPSPYFPDQRAEFPTEQEAQIRSARALEAYTGGSKWKWEGTDKRKHCRPHPKLPRLLAVSSVRHPRTGMWLPGWTLVAGRDYPGRRFFQWVSVWNDGSVVAPLHKSG